MFLIGLELYLKECLLMQECIPSGVLFRQAPYPSGVLPDMLSGIKKGSTSQGGDFKSAETPSGGAAERHIRRGRKTTDAKTQETDELVIVDYNYIYPKRYRLVSMKPRLYIYSSHFLVKDVPLRSKHMLQFGRNKYIY